MNPLNVLNSSVLSSRFECTKCGKCCTGPQGSKVWLTAHEVAAIEALGHRDFMDGGSIRPVPFGETYACPFLKDQQCTVYEARPSQCRTFPFWPENMASQEAWNRVAQRCEGIS